MRNVSEESYCKLNLLYLREWLEVWMRDIIDVTVWLSLLFQPEPNTNGGSLTCYLVASRNGDVNR